MNNLTSHGFVPALWADSLLVAMELNNSLGYKLDRDPDYLVKQEATPACECECECSTCSHDWMED